ncbi:MAG: GyrI-like domain-containing protein, partial [Lachnospiraceae bacterium]|nr:GyrI-like domain-containing protein [Lachnospiraceae bacterium]
QISIKGEKEMNYRIETKEDFHVFGIEIMASLSGEEGFLRPDQLWKKCQSNGEYDKLYEDAGGLPEFVPQDLCRIHAVENYRKTEGNTFSYMLFAFTTKNSKTDGYTKMHIPSQTYAVFSSDKFRWDEFNDVLSGMQKRFYSEWLPTANYERVDAANFEIYGGDEELGYLELWFPVNKK